MPSNPVLRAQEPKRLRGMEIFEIKPIILGGDPFDLKNKAFLSRKEHIEAVRYWNRVIHEMRYQQKCRNQ